MPSYLFFKSAMVYAAGESDDEKENTACSKEKFGLRWRSGKVRCGVPNQFAGHKSLRAKRDRGMNSRESAFIFTESGELYPVGTREYMHFPS